jgi:cyclophilin family peptidyl-prolyl cis-trans isomerase
MRRDLTERALESHEARHRLTIVTASGAKDCSPNGGRNLMKRVVAVLMLTAALALALALPTAAAEKGKDHPVVVISTSMGDMEVELYPDKAPKTVENFLWYVDKKFYDGLIFHRVIDNFMIQAGGFAADSLTGDMAQKKGNAPIQNEATNGVSNEKYTIAMARLNDPHSASSQFFINSQDNPGLDHRDTTSPRGWGYCVFGKVISGTQVVDKIGKVKTGMKNGMNDVPVKPVTILKAYRKTETKKSG